MNAKRIPVLVVLLLVAVTVGACQDVSCWADLSTTDTSEGAGSPESTVTAGATTSSQSPTTSSQNSTTSDSGAYVTTTAPATTLSTASALDLYRDDMRAWKSKYAADMQKNYNILSAMSNPLDPTDEQVKAARALADLMDGLVPDLEGIGAPPELSGAHASYAASLKDMHQGVDRLAKGFEDGGFLGAVDVTRAFATIYAADKDGQGPRAALEQALGFSLTSAD